MTIGVNGIKWGWCEGLPLGPQPTPSGYGNAGNAGDDWNRKWSQPEEHKALDDGHRATIMR